MREMKKKFNHYLFIYLFISVLWGPYWSHVKGFWEQRNKPNILFLKFEDITEVQYTTHTIWAASSETSAYEHAHNAHLGHPAHAQSIIRKFAPHWYIL